MRWQIFAVGKPKLPFAAAGIEEYAGRLKGFAPVEVHYLKPGAREAEGAAFLERSAGMLRIVLDERGSQLSSQALSVKIAGWEQRSVKTAAVIIGGADGHAESLRVSADWLWALSELTLQHEMALMFVLEQLYRAYTIKAGLPYHRQ